MFRSSCCSADFFVARLGVRMGVLGLAAVLVLGACSNFHDDQGAEAAEGGSSSAPPVSGIGGGAVTESASASPTPTPRPAPTAVYKPATAEGSAENVPLPVMPEPAKQESKEGLEAFVRHWFALINYGYETGDVEAVRATSGASCMHCEGYFRAIEKGYKGDDWIVGGTLELRGIGTEFVRTPENRYQVVVSVMELPSVYHGPGGVIYGEKKGSDYSFAQILEAVYVENSWKIELVDFLG